MKHILSVLTLFGLTACTTAYQAKNNSGEPIYIGDEKKGPGECGEVVEFFWMFSAEFHKVKKEGEADVKGDWIGKEEGYDKAGHYTVNNTTQTEGAITYHGAEDDNNPCKEPAGTTTTPATDADPLKAAKEKVVSTANEANAIIANKVKKALENRYNATSGRDAQGSQKVVEDAAQKQTEINFKVLSIIKEANSATSEAAVQRAQEKADAVKKEAEAVSV